MEMNYKGEDGVSLLDRNTDASEIPETPIPPTTGDAESGKSILNRITDTAYAMKTPDEDRQIEVPTKSIYVTFLMILMYEKSHKCFVAYFSVLNFALLGLNILAQLTFIMYIGKLAALDDEICPTDPQLLWLCSLLFYMLILGDFKQSLRLLVWLFKVTKRELQIRIVGILFVIVPKFTVCVLLGWYGGSWLMHAKSDQDLILNCVALFFITEIDEMIQKYLGARFLDDPKIIDNFKKEKDVKWPNHLDGFSNVVGPILSIGLFAGTTAVSHHFNCGFDTTNTTGSLTTP